MNFLASEVAARFLGLLVLLEGLAAIAISLIYSVPYAVRRLKLYPEHSARRTFARNTLVLVVVLTMSVAVFIAVGAITVIFESTPLRMSIVRLLLVGGITGICAAIIWIPFGHSKIEVEANKEAEERKEKAETLENYHQERHAENERREESNRSRTDPEE